MLLLCEGWGSFATTAAITKRGWTNDDDTKITLDTGTGPHGGNAIMMVNADGGPVTRTGVVRDLADNCDGASGVVRVSFSFKNSGYGGSTPEAGGETLVMLRGPAEDTGLFGADAPSWSINLSSGGAIQIEDMTDNTANFRNAVATGSISIIDGNWHDVEVYFKSDETTAGEVKVWVDGTLDVNVSGIQTAKVGWSDISALTICDVSMGKTILATLDTCWFGHLLVWDDRAGGLTGELPTHRIRIDTLKPVSDAGPNEWPGSAAGDHSALVDDAYDEDVSYIQSGVKYARDMHSYEPLGFTPPADVVGLNMVGYARNPNDGTQQMRMVAVNGSDVAVGDDFTIDNTYKCFEQFFAESPAGSVWDEGLIDSTIFGVEPRDGS
jgi:hypothetical protein